MSTFVKHERPATKGGKLAIFLGIVWLALLALMWFSYRNDEGEGGGFLHFIARFHIIIVHLPIGVIFLGAAMEFLARFTAFQHLRLSIPFVHWIAFLGAIAATLVGYLLMSVEGFEGRAMDLHMYFGLAVVVCALFAVIFSAKKNFGLSTLSIFAAAAMSMTSGHFGGAMVHEGDYLTEHAPAPLVPLLELGLASHKGGEEKPEGEEGVAEVPIGERLVYSNFVVPILEAKCNECHNENKIKGKLRMDTHELLLAGAEGSDFPTVIPGDADESELIVRVTLPSDHDEFMPTKGDPLTPEEIEFLSLWIKSGAKTETKVAELGEDPSIEALALGIEASYGSSEDVTDAAIATYDSVWDTLTPEEQQERMDEVLLAAEKYSFSVMPISAEDDRLRVNVINAAKEFGDDQLKLLEPVADRVVWLDLARSQVTDEGLKTVGKMRALERLHLENTAVTDAGVAELGSLAQLEYLNLYGTQVGNGIFTTFETLPNLKKVYVWQTQVDASAAKTFERSVNLEINTGVDVSAATPPAEPE
ncbi:MAG: hypothetical protein P1U85_17115, partial [Verrucomicrobiales bacterium]|nr:hypothetical protein [Verrucomicrobiales bacterium]